MSKLIAPEVINDILERCDIVEIIGSYIPLKKAGRNFKANCPFHNEKTPSFVVSPDKQIYHCFGCNKGGSALNFLMEYERMDFKEALEVLAKKSGVELKFSESRDNKEDTFVSELFRVNEIAADFYHNYLLKNSDQKLQDYFKLRDISFETMKKFKIGFAPNQWETLINYLRTKGINLKIIDKAGLAVAKENGGFYDRFRNRLIIPIYDVKNRVVAFGARSLGDEQPKYINSPETPIYFKGKTLYGLNIAKDAIREKDSCVIVEGYFDVIMPMQTGINNIVCSSGTALTIEQVKLLKRYTKNIIVIYDADTAGRLATLRSLDLFIEEEIQVKIVNLPKGYDPDLFVRKSGANKFNELINNALDIFDYKLKLLCETYDVKKANDKTKIANEMLVMIKKIKNEILKSEYIKQLSERIKVDQTTLLKELNKIRSDKSIFETEKAQNSSYIFPKNEGMLIKLIIEDAQIANEIKDFIDPSELQDARLRKILALAFKLYDTHPQFKPNQLITYIEDENCVNLISCLTSDETLACATEQRNDIVIDCIKRIKSNNINNACKNIQEKIKNSQKDGDLKCVDSLMTEFNLLIKQRRELNEEIRN